MMTNAVKCSNKKCKEVFHLPDNKVPGGINDRCLVTIECKKCGALTKVVLHNFNHIYNTNIYNIIKKKDIEEKDVFTILSEVGETAYIDGYELINNPLHQWDMYDTFSLWRNDKYNFEQSATTALNNAKDKIINNLFCYFNAYSAGQYFAPEIKKVFVYQTYKVDKKKCKALWMADLKTREDLNIKDFYLIHHNDTAKIDGIYSRDNSLKYLERLLVRWRALCSEVIVATPFIGYDFPFSKDSDKEELIALWKLLNGLLDMEKTLFFTRSTTYCSLKKNQNTIDIPTDVLREWDLMTNLQKVVDNPKTKAKMKDKFHLKIYAGVFDDHVELFSGSYNVQTNETMENMCCRTLTREHFKTYYMDVMMENFEYRLSNNENVLLISIDKENNDKCKISNIEEINKLTQKKSCFSF